MGRMPQVPETLVTSKGMTYAMEYPELVDYMLFFNEARWPIRSAAQFLQLLSLADTRFV
jgi:hypothetical protein